MEMENNNIEEIKPKKNRTLKILSIVLSILIVLALILSILCNNFMTDLKNAKIESPIKKPSINNGAIVGYSISIFLLFLTLTVIIVITAVILYLTIKKPRTIVYDGNIDFEEVSNYENIKLSNNNIYSLLDIKVKIYQAKSQNEYAICKIKIKPQLKNYIYMSSAITILVNNKYKKTIFLNHKGVGKTKFSILTSKYNEKFQIIETKGSMLLQNK